MSSLFSASEHLVGYLYQVRYALLVLLQKIKDDPGIELSLERLDDVSFESNGEATELLQTKHHINKAAKLTDASPDLWKTIRVWSTHILDNANNCDDLVLLLITTSNAPDRSLTSKLRRDSQRREDYAFQELVRVAKESDNRANKPAYEKFLSLSDSQQKTLVSKIFIIDGSPDIQDVENRLSREVRLLSRHPDSLKSRLEGWWFKRAIDHLVDADRGNIKGIELQSEIYTLQDQLRATSLPNDFPTGVVEMGEEELNENERIFVEQLRLILSSNSRLRIAIGDYYRAFQQRSKWLSEGLLYPQELQEYEDYLIGEWRRQFETMKEDIEESSPDSHEITKHGKSIFRWAQENNFRPIRSDYIDAYLSRGSYHILANSLQVGWHPEFAERLSHLIQEAASRVS
jgi:hypothetical protein